MRATTITNKKYRKLTVWNNVVPREANDSVILANEYLRLHVGILIAKGAPQSVKTYCGCKHKLRFSCTCRLRSCRSDATGKTVLEEHGIHEHNLQNKNQSNLRAWRTGFKLSSATIWHSVAHRLKYEFKALSPSSTSSVYCIASARRAISFFFF